MFQDIPRLKKLVLFERIDHANAMAFWRSKTESTMVGEEKVEHPLEELFLLYPELNPDLGLLQIHGFITETVRLRYNLNEQ